ncbi:uncharacterized protein LOC128222448 [Mya arenaria]|uniref:uncharacterized protein LOC128222448 n=1 Tax=Mya arenaria TaxID=6604 RepID=UPI0022E0175A|nr:uncharacterized protein LOC128222448 [Mya arenaria]
MLREVARDVVNNPIYSAKCERETICRVLSLYGRRSLGCIKCCTTDRCNNHCGADTVTTTTGPAFTQATLPIVTHIATTSGQGIKCYSCGLMSDPAACSNIVTCERGQQCMLKSEGADMQNGELYSAKCEKDVVCNAVSMLGRRSSRTSCVHCCTTDLCNNNCGHLPSHPPTITSTIATPKLTTTASTSQSTTIKTTTPTLIQSSISSTTPVPSTSGNLTAAGDGVQCYNCDYMADPSRCSNIVQCPIGHVCMLRSVNFNVQGGTHIYKASCESQQSCHMAESLAAGGFSSCVVCCNSDLCNNKCPQQSMASPTTHVPTTSSHINLPHPTILQPTLQTQLPTTTQNASGLGLHCYACGNMASPHDCNHVTICNKNEICFLYESENEIAQRKLFHSRCNTNQVCDVLQHLPPIKSNHTGIELCHTCCSTPLCNNHCDFSNHPTLPPAPTRPPPTTTTTADGIVSTTITREDCENHRYVHIPYADLCFKFHFLNHTWDEAAAVCRAEGGRVATLPTENQFTIMQTLVGITPEYRHKMVYIGAKDRHHNGTYFWDRGQEMTSQILHARGVSTITSDGCVIMTYSNGYALGIQACTLKGPFICTKP